MGQHRDDSTGVEYVTGDLASGAGRTSWLIG